MENQVEVTLLAKLKETETLVINKFKEQGEESDRKIQAAIKEVRDELMPIIKKNAGTSVSIAGLEGKDLKDLSVARLINSIMHKDKTLAPREHEVCDQARDLALKNRDVSAATGGAGGYLIPMEWSNEIIPLPQANIVARKLGAQFLMNLQGNLPIPKILTRPTLSFTGETTAVSASSDPTFGEVNLTPRRGAMLVKVSKRVLMQTAQVAEQIVREQMNIGVELGVDNEILNGTGTSGRPLGIINTPSLSTTTGKASGAVDTNGDRFRVKNARAMVKTLDVANLLRDGGKFGFAMRPEVLYGMLNERVAQYSGQASGDGMPVMMLNPFMTPEQLASAMGHQFLTTTQMSATVTQGSSSTNSDVLFGDWSYEKVGFWGGIELMASDSAGDSSGSAFTQNQVWITINLHMDCALTNVNAMTIMHGAETLESNWTV